MNYLETIKITSERQMFVVTGKGELQLLQVQPATKKVMEIYDFVNGYQIKSGESLST